MKSRIYLLFLISSQLIFAFSAHSAATLRLNKKVYDAGEVIHIHYSGSENTSAIIAVFPPAYDPAGGERKGPPYLFVETEKESGRIAITTPLPAGRYVMALVEKKSCRALTDSVAFAVTYDPGIKNGYSHQLFIGPGDVPGMEGNGFADPQVMKNGRSWYITGTYNTNRGYLIETQDWQNKKIHLMEFDYNIPYLREHFSQENIGSHICWAFEVYKHTDGSWHGYGAILIKGWWTAICHFSPDPDPKATKAPITRWKLDKVLIDKAYDNHIVHEGKDLYMIYSSGEAGHIYLFAQKMKNPLELDENDAPRILLSDHKEALASELRNIGGTMKLYEAASISRIHAPGGTKYVMPYNVSDFALRSYKIGVAFSDTLMPAEGREYEKIYFNDEFNAWGSGSNAREVCYILQSQKKSLPNYHGRAFRSPGSGDIVHYKNNFYLLHHANFPPPAKDSTGQLSGYSGLRWTWLTPVDINFASPPASWLKASLPQDGTVAPGIASEKPHYEIGEKIVIHIENSAANWNDKVALFRASDSPLADVLNWSYTGNTQQPPGDLFEWEKRNEGVIDGCVEFKDGLPRTGNYEAHLFFADGETPAATAKFQVQ